MMSSHRDITSVITVHYITLLKSEGNKINITPLGARESDWGPGSETTWSDALTSLQAAGLRVIGATLVQMQVSLDCITFRSDKEGYNRVLF